MQSLSYEFELFDFWCARAARRNMHPFFLHSPALNSLSTLNGPQFSSALSGDNSHHAWNCYRAISLVAQARFDWQTGARTHQHQTLLLIKSNYVEVRITEEFVACTYWWMSIKVWQAHPAPTLCVLGYLGNFLYLSDPPIAAPNLFSFLLTI